eukprot:m.82085 g.82085  ORF g.82085 m.82085 type:complete len:118 (+) comp50768_c0_seq4:1203-1556(+)
MELRLPCSTHDFDAMFYVEDQTVRNILAELSPDLARHDGEALVLALASFLRRSQQDVLLHPTETLSASPAEFGKNDDRVFFRQGDPKDNRKFIFTASICSSSYCEIITGALRLEASS